MCAPLYRLQRHTDVTGIGTRPLGHAQDSPTVQQTAGTALCHFTGTAHKQLCCPLTVITVPFHSTTHKQLCCPLTVITVPFHWHNTQTPALSGDCFSNGGRVLVSRTRRALSSATSRITRHPPVVAFLSLHFKAFPCVALTHCLFSAHNLSLNNS